MKRASQKKSDRDISRRNLSRRNVLLGLGGVSVGLPFLDSIAPKEAVAAGETALPFAIFCRQGNGVQQLINNDEPERFWPSFAPGAMTQAQLAADTERALSELSAHAAKLNIIRGIDFPGNGCGHSGGGNQCLTAAKVSQSPSGNLSLAEGESIDNLIQRQLGDAGVEPLTLYVGPKYGYLDEVMSYRGAQQLRAAENNPYNVYMDLFGLNNVDPEILAQLQKKRKSVNDLVRSDMQALLARKDLSKVDRQKLDLHFSGIRDLEIGLQCGLSDGEVADMQAMSANSNDDDLFEDICHLQMDVIALAMACGKARAATLQFGSGNCGVGFYVGGNKQKSFHKISHRIDGDGDVGPPIPDADVLHHEIDRIHARLFGYLLTKLDSYEFSDGTLLDAGVAVWLNDLGEKYHSYRRVPYILAGGAKGKLTTGQYLDVGSQTNNKLFNVIGTALGCTKSGGQPLDNFGDSSLEPGYISGLLKA
jgi:hypothetical protein